MKIVSKKLLVLSILTLMLQGCISSTDNTTKTNLPSVNSSNNKEMKDQAFIEKLAGLQRRNPVADAQQAIDSGDKRFIAKAGRGLNVPSINSATYSQVKNICGLRYENGFGDVIYGKNHSRYYKAFVNYAGQYNLTILRACR